MIIRRENIDGERKELIKSIDDLPLQQRTFGVWIENEDNVEQLEDKEKFDYVGYF